MAGIQEKITQRDEITREIFHSKIWELRYLHSQRSFSAVSAVNSSKQEAVTPVVK